MDESKSESRDTHVKMQAENLFLSLKNLIFSKHSSRQKCLEISLVIWENTYWYSDMSSQILIH